MTINIKPLSVNRAYQGRRFKTPEYHAYERAVMAMLRPMVIPEPPLSVTYHFGMSNVTADIDNGIKPFQDLLQKRYGFNDRDIFRMVVTKSKVKKGSEFISFEIQPYLESF